MYKQGEKYTNEEIGRIMVAAGQDLEKFYRLRYKAEEAGNEVVYQLFDKRISETRAFIAYIAMEQAKLRLTDPE